MIAWDCFTKLLHSPFGGWVRGEIAVPDAPRPDFHEKENIQGSEPSGHHDQEIAGHDGLRVVADKRRPVL